MISCVSLDRAEAVQQKPIPVVLTVPDDDNICVNDELIKHWLSLDLSPPHDAVTELCTGNDHPGFMSLVSL